MKNLVKLLTVIFCTTMTTSTFAQTFGLKAGFNLSNITATNSAGTISGNFEMLPGFHVGPTAEFGLTELLSLETGLILSTKGYQLMEEEEIFGIISKSEVTSRLFYLDIPLMAKGTFDMGSVQLFAAAGPYLGIGLKGNTNTVETYDGETNEVDYEIDWGTDEEEDELRRFDFGLSAGVGIQIKSIEIGASYDLGLANVSAFRGDETKANHGVIKISIGFRLVGAEE